MAPKTPPSKEDQDIAVALIVMVAAANDMGDERDDVTALAHQLWPKAIHRDALLYGPGACTALVTAFGIDPVELTKLSQHLVAM